MPPVATPTEQDLVEILKQRGLLATGGNIRSIPFADDASSPSASSDGSAGTTPLSSGAIRPQGATPLIGPNNTLLDPTTKKPLDDQSAGDWWKYLLAGAGVAGGAALASLLRRKGAKGSVSADEAIPTVEGEVITDPLSPLPAGSNIINGEYSDVVDPTLAGGQKGITGPSTAQVLADRNRQLTARNRPGANPVAESDTSRIRLGDAASEFTPEEIAQARSLAHQLVQNRVKGNAQRANTGNLTRRAGPPTGDTNEESLFNTVLRILRQTGARPLVRAIP